MLADMMRGWVGITADASDDGDDGTASSGSSDSELSANAGLGGVYAPETLFDEVRNTVLDEKEAAADRIAELKRQIVEAEDQLALVYLQRVGATAKADIAESEARRMRMGGHVLRTDGAAVVATAHALRDLGIDQASLEAAAAGVMERQAAAARDAVAGKELRAVEEALQVPVPAS